MQRLAELPLAAVVIEARYSALYKLEHVDGNWLADQLARLEVRYPEVHLVFADSRRYAEDWTYRFLTTAVADTTDPNPSGAARHHQGCARCVASSTRASRRACNAGYWGPNYETPAEIRAYRTMAPT
jgi:hypothetical protein